MKTTAVGAAASLAEAIIQNTNVLQDRLAGEGFGWTHPARAGSDECLLECTIFEWFLRDIAGPEQSGSRVEAVRRALPGRLLVDLQRSGLSPACLADFGQRYQERFREYEQGLALGASRQALGAMAWRRISGSDQPSDRMTMLLSIRAVAELAGRRGLG